MKIPAFLLIPKFLVFLLLCSQSSFANPSDSVPHLYELKLKNLKNQKIDFSDFRGQVLLIVNTASKCGFTSQLGGLQKLHEQYSAQGLLVLGFPSNDFRQEKADNAEIAKFCKLNYGVEFTMFKKSNVKGVNRSPVYDYLVTQSDKPQSDVAWNFEKFVVNKKGEVVARFPSKVKPQDDELVNVLKKALSAG